MIKFLGNGDGMTLVGLGLSRRNCEKLLEGKPIAIDLNELFEQSHRRYSDFDVKKITILIMGGETEDEIAKTVTREIGAPDRIVDFQERQ